MLNEIRAVVTCITLPVYTILLLVLVRQRQIHFQSTFYIFFISTGIADIFNCFVRIGFDYIPSFIIDTSSYVNSPLPFATMSWAFFYFIQYVQILGIIIISANRLTAVAIPFKYAAVWSQQNAICALVVQWVLPMLWIVPTFHPCCQCEFINGTILPVFKDELVQNITYIIDGISGAFIAPVAIVTINVLIVVYMRKSNQANQSISRTDQKRKSEMRLTIVGCILSATFITAVLGQVIVWLMILEIIPYIDSTVEFAYQWYLNFFDIFTLCNPYLLLFLSSVARRQFFAFFGIKELTVNPLFATTTNHTPQGRSFVK